MMLKGNLKGFEYSDKRYKAIPIERVELLNSNMLKKIGISREDFLANAAKLRQEEVELWLCAQSNLSCFN